MEISNKAKAIYDRMCAMNGSASVGEAYALMRYLRNICFEFPSEEAQLMLINVEGMICFYRPGRV